MQEIEKSQFELSQPIQSYHGLSVKEKDEEMKAILTRLRNKKPEEKIPIANTPIGIPLNKYELAKSNLGVPVTAEVPIDEIKKPTPTEIMDLVVDILP